MPITKLERAQPAHPGDVERAQLPQDIQVWVRAVVNLLCTQQPLDCNWRRDQSEMFGGLRYFARGQGMFNAEYIAQQPGGTEKRCLLTGNRPNRVPQT